MATTKKRNWRGVSDKVAKDKQDIYNSREWKELRIAKLRSTNVYGICTCLYGSYTYLQVACRSEK